MKRQNIVWFASRAFIFSETAYAYLFLKIFPRGGCFIELNIEGRPILCNLKLLRHWYAVPSFTEISRDSTEWNCIDLDTVSSIMNDLYGISKRFCRTMERTQSSQSSDFSPVLWYGFQRTTFPSLLVRKLSLCLTHTNSRLTSAKLLLTQENSLRAVSLYAS
jgi:hypothetical protein